MSPVALVELLAQLKQMTLTNLDQTRHLLLTQPQLTIAVFQALLKMNLIDQ
jgi:cleavage stimulation factor subunit 2